jgi:hypothetical protein
MPSTMNYSEHVLVEALVTDLAVPPELRYADGWVGTSNRRGYVRLYRDLALNEFWDLPEDRVLHIHELPPTEALPFGLNVMWVDVRPVPETGEPVVYWRRGARSEKLPLTEVEQAWRGGDDEGDEEPVDRFPPVASAVPRGTLGDDRGLIPSGGDIPGLPSGAPHNNGHRMPRRTRTRLPH